MANVHRSPLVVLHLPEAKRARLHGHQRPTNRGSVTAANWGRCITRPPSAADDGLHVRAQAEPAFDTYDRAPSLWMSTTEMDQCDVPRVVPRLTSQLASHPQKRSGQLDTAMFTLATAMFGNVP